MKTLLTLIMIVLSSAALANDCITEAGSEYECGNTASMILSLTATLKPFSASVYKWRIDTVSNNTTAKVGRHMVTYSQDGTTPTDTYFQDYIYNKTKGRFHLYHFVKNSEGRYDIYGERDQMPSGSLTEDILQASDDLEYIGTLQTAEINDKGMMTSSTLFSEFGTYNILNHDEKTLTFSIQEDDPDGELVVNEIYDFEYTILF